MTSAEADPSSGEEELINWAQPTAAETAKLNEKLALRRLPRPEQLRVRKEALQAEVRKALANKKAIEEKMRKIKNEPKDWIAGDPLADIETMFDVFEANTAYENQPETVEPVELIKCPFNKAVYDFAARYFPYFVKHHNLLIQKDPTIAFKHRGEFIIYIHEDCSSGRSIWGIGITGTISKARSLRLLRIPR